MRITKEVWNNPVRLRMTLENISKLLFTMSLVNGIWLIGQRSWILGIMNLVVSITPLIIIISKMKYNKETP